MAYTVHQAKTHFSRLLKEAEAGHEVVVLRGSKPVARLVPFEQPAEAELPYRLLGAFEGKLHYEDSAFAPASDAELAEMGFDLLLDAGPAPAQPQS